MKTHPLALLPALLLPALLTACTGTEEPSPNVRIAILTDGGKTLGYTDTKSDTGGYITPTFTPVETVNDGVGLLTLNTGANVALTRAGGLEQRDVNLVSPVAFGALPFAQTCLTTSALNSSRDRILTLSDCGALQEVALYRTDRTLIWVATLPTKPLPIPTSDTPPTRIAVLASGDSAVIARASLSGGSEVVRVAPRRSGDPIQDLVAVVSDPIPTVSIRDLAPFGSSIYAATDTGVRPLQTDGTPNPAADLGSVTAFGLGRVDRLWSGYSGSRALLAAWRDNRSSGNGTEPLRLWDGSTSTTNTALKVGDFAGIRDLAFDLDSQMYVLTFSSLARYDTLLGLQQNNWAATTLLYGLNDARQMAWLVP